MAKRGVGLYDDPLNVGMIIADIRQKGHKRVRRSFTTVTRAKAWRTKTIAAMNAGTYKSDEQVATEEAAAEKSSITLKEATQIYLDTVTIHKESKKSMENESAVFSLLNRMDFANLPILEIKQHHIQSFIKAQRERGNIESTIIRKMTTIAHLFVVAKGWEHLEALENPCPGQKPRLPKSQKRRKRNFTGTEEADLMDGLDGCYDPMIKLVVQYAIETGCRRREILENEWKNVHHHKNYSYVYIPAPIAKTRTERNVPLSPVAIEILKKLTRITGKRKLMFPLSTDSFEDAFDKARKRAGIKNFQFRDTRHVALTRLSKIYPRAQDLARISGHDKLDTLLTYYEDDIEEQCSIMGDYFQE